MSLFLKNYRQLVSRIDGLCRIIESALGKEITCSVGCSSCCTSITVFPVEAAALREELRSLPELQRKSIQLHVAQHKEGERCPLLSGQRCLLYKARPIICRTHGLPLTYSEEGIRKSDCCPLNLKGVEITSGEYVIDLDKLNTLLVAVNSHFLTQWRSKKDSDRLTIAEAIIDR